MENKNLIRALREIGLTEREARREIKRTGIDNDKTNYYHRTQRPVYDILCPLYKQF